MKNFLYILLLFVYSVQAHEFDFSELVKDQSESVVNIQSTSRVKVSQRSLNSFPEELFREFGFPFPDIETPRQQERESVQDKLDVTNKLLAQLDEKAAAEYALLEGGIDTNDATVRVFT